MRHGLKSTLVCALAALVIYFAWRGGALVCSHVSWAAFKKVTSFVLFWSFFISLIRMWWKIGSYYGRKS